jgi:serine/alanine adding enzyme
VSGLVEIDTRGWDELLARLDLADAYLLSDYLASACVLEPGRPARFHLAGDGGDVVFAVLVRELPSGGGHDLITPYGYGGPVATGAEPPVGRFWELYQAWCEANDVVTSFIRFHPLFANQRLASPECRLELLASTVGWRLDLPDLFAGMHGTHRTACRKAVRAGVTVTATEAPAELSGFVSLYEETMRRVQAREFYLFPQPYWDALAALGERIVLFRAERDGEVLAAALCLATRPWLHYHLGATAERGRALGASNLLLYEAARWAQDRGYERFHLGGGAGGQEDSLHSFKHRFDPDGPLLECAVGKIVHEPVAYRALTGRDADDLDGFFPAYREAR